MAPFRSFVCVLGAFAVICRLPVAFGDEPVFLSLGDLPSGGSGYPEVEAVSADGAVVVGYFSRPGIHEAFRWTEATGIVGLGIPSWGTSSAATDVSDDGTLIVGGVNTSSGTCQAARWTEAEGWVRFCDLPGGSGVQTAYRVSADGLLVVGQSTAGLACRWTEETGLENLGDLPGGGEGSYAMDVSPDGSVIVGYGFSDAAGPEAFRWTSAGGMVALGDLSGGPAISYARAVSADGSVVVGDSQSASGLEAFRWTQAEGIVGLGDLSGGTFESEAHGVSGEGNLVVGYGEGGVGPCGSRGAMIWDPVRGMRCLHEVLTNEYGLNLVGWWLTEATDITPDGRTIIGTGRDPDQRPRGWIARLNCGATGGVLDCNSNGTLDVCDLDSGVSRDCQANGRLDECDIAAGTSGDCNLNAVPDQCEIASGTAHDCNTNGVPDLCDLATGASFDCDANNTPDECELVGAPFARITSAVSRKTHDVVGPQDIPVSVIGHVEAGNVTSEPRVVGITQLRIAFEAAPGGPGPNPVALEERTCASGVWQPYSGESQAVTSIAGNTLVVSFAPPLENARTYRITLQREVTSILCQSVEVRNLKGDVNSDGWVNGADRSVVVGAWTGPGFTARTDIDLSGRTDAADRSTVVGVWTGSQNCAP